MGPRGEKPAAPQCLFAPFHSWCLTLVVQQERVYVGGDDAGTHRLAVLPDEPGKTSPSDQKVTTEQPGAQIAPPKTPSRQQRMVSWQETSASTKQLPELVQKVCSDLQHPADSEKVLEYLKQEQWIVTVDELRELADEDWKEVRLPVRLKRSLRKCLAM
eukprot:4054661-Amphidinium_carterae.1